MGAASAEVIYNRANSGEPETLDPHKTSTVHEAHILRDMLEGLVDYNAKAKLIPGQADEVGGQRRRQDLPLQPARRRSSGRTATR